jgi:hypothetical protein
LPANSKVAIQLRFDEHPPFGQVATIPSRQLVLVPLPDSTRQIQAFRRTSKLNLVAEGRSFLFKLRGSSAVMGQLTRCVRTSVALEAHAAPAGIAGAALPAFEAEIAFPAAPRSFKGAPRSFEGAPRSFKAAAAPAAASTIGAGAPGVPSPIANPVAAEAQTASAMSAWVSIMALGALMGVFGQGIRVVVGLKRVGDEAAELGHKFIGAIEPARLTIGLLIGALAGVVAALVTMPVPPVSRAALLGGGGRLYRSRFG